MTRQLGLISIAVFLLAGCGGSSNNSPVIVQIDIEPKIATLDIGTSELYQVIAADSDGNISDVTDRVRWSLENQSGIVEISQNPDYPGFAFALAVIAGQDNIVATLAQLSSTSAVTVVEAQLIDLMVSPTETDLPIGAQETFSAEGTYGDGHMQDLTNESTWTVANPAVASISEDGVVTAESEGSTTIAASLDGLSDISNVTVRDPVEIESVEVSPQDVGMIIDGAQQFNAFVHYTDGSIQSITKSALWISSNTAVVSQDLTRKGLFHANSEGNAEITAEFNINNKGTSQVTVSQLVITEIIVTPSNFTLAVGDKKNYFTEAVDSSGRLYSVNQSPSQSYSIADPSVAYVSNDPDEKGQLTALKAGTTTVFSMFVYEDSVFSDEATITVIP
jgi:hypothetical protein